MPSTFTAIDLSQIPAPDVIDPLDYETIYAEMLAKLREFVPDFDDSIESDPAVRVLQVAAYFRLLDRQEKNEDARGVMLAYAQGGDLDQIGANLGVTRLVLIPADEEAGTPAVMESDEDLRYRITLAPEGYSVAGPRGAYLFYALSADAAVADASANSPAPDDIRQIALDILTAHSADPALVSDMTDALDAAVWPGQVVVNILSREGDGTASPALIASVEAALSEEDVRPLTDQVTVQSTVIVDYAIEAEIWTFAGPDSAVVMAEAQTRIDAWVVANRRNGRDITRAGINAALFAGGVQNINLIAPAVDLLLDDSQAGNCTGITLSWAGVAE